MIRNVLSGVSGSHSRICRRAEGAGGAQLPPVSSGGSSAFSSREPQCPEDHDELTATSSRTTAASSHADAHETGE